MKRIIRKTIWVFWVILAGCAAGGAAPVQEVLIPTLIPSPTAEIDLDAAERAAISFLDAWQRQDFPSMYALLSFASQETVSPDDFRIAYQNAQNTATIVSLTFQPRSILRNGRVVQLYYDVAFETNILGSFSDMGRTLNIIFDAQVEDWRIAWSVSDIFLEMGRGARLEFDSRVPSRANIYDRDGLVLADMNGLIAEVYIVQEKAPDWETCYQSLIDAVGVSPQRLDALIANAQPNWVVSIGTLEPAAYRQNRQRLEDECNATFDSMPIRRYKPTGSVMPHILGYVGYPTPEEIPEITRLGFNSETILGRAGVERSWDETLRGNPGGSLSLIGPDGTRLRFLADAASQIPESIWLTVDTDLQNFVLEVIGRAYLENRVAANGNPSWGRVSPGASAVVMDVNTGEILAMASYPFFDNNAYTPFPAIGREVANLHQQEIAEDPRLPQLNRATQGIYPSGSIFKVIDAIAVLDSGLYEEDQTYYCGGTWQYENDLRFDWLPGGHGSETTQSAIAHSCNPFFYQTGFALNERDPYLLPNYARRMGLGQPTGLVDLAEAAGTITDPDIIRVDYGRTWTYSDAVNMAIGQGEVEVTPLQIVRMYAAIANGGTLYRPQIVRERGILDQRTFLAEPDPMSYFEVSQESLDIVRAGMCDVTQLRNGTAAHIFDPAGQARSPLQDYRGGVCGKTGTAQSPRPGAAPHSWFAAYAPADEPEIAVVVMVENAGDGSAVAAPLTKQIMEYYFFLRE